MTDLKLLDYAARSPDVGHVASQLPGMWAELADMLRAEGRGTLREGSACMLRDELRARLQASSYAWLSEPRTETR